jgi:hypothetical protein
MTRIHAKLTEAAFNAGLGVRAHVGLDGASVVGRTVEAYVVAVSRGGFQVEMWRANGRNPYKIKCCSDLDEAVTAAVAAATGRRRSAAAARTNSWKEE